MAKAGEVFWPQILGRVCQKGSGQAGWQAQGFGGRQKASCWRGPPRGRAREEILMRRVSNLAFNRKFTERTGVVGFGAGSGVQIRRDRDNPYDADAVGIFLADCPAVPLGWLYRKDSNRDAVLRRLDADGTLDGRLEVQRRGGKEQKVVVFWL